MRTLVVPARPVLPMARATTVIAVPVERPRTATLHRPVAPTATRGPVDLLFRERTVQRILQVVQ